MAETILEEHRSPDGLLHLCVVRDETGDIAMGFRNSPWHTHADIEASTRGLPPDAAVRRFVDDILADRTPIGIERREDGAIDWVWPAEGPTDGFDEDKPADHTVEHRFWSGRPVVWP